MAIHVQVMTSSTVTLISRLSAKNVAVNSRNCCYCNLHFTEDRLMSLTAYYSAILTMPQKHCSSIKQKSNIPKIDIEYEKKIRVSYSSASRALNFCHQKKNERNDDFLLSFSVDIQRPTPHKISTAAMMSLSENKLLDFEVTVSLGLWSELSMCRRGIQREPSVG